VHRERQNTKPKKEQCCNLFKTLRADSGEADAQMLDVAVFGESMGKVGKNQLLTYNVHGKFVTSSGEVETGIDEGGLAKEWWRMFRQMIQHSTPSSAAFEKLGGGMLLPRSGYVAYEIQRQHERKSAAAEQEKKIGRMDSIRKACLRSLIDIHGTEPDGHGGWAAVSDGLVRALPSELCPLLFDYMREGEPASDGMEDAVVRHMSALGFTANRQRRHRRAAHQRARRGR